MSNTATNRRNSFLTANGYGAADIVSLPGDASARRYHRLSGKGLLLMEEAPGAPDLKSFATISRYLKGLGLSSPDIRLVDFDLGLALIEDFGSQTFTRLLQEGQPEQSLYELAVDALVHLHETCGAEPLAVPTYDFGPLVAELEMFTQWYVPQCDPGLDAAAFEDAFLAEWRSALAGIAQCREVLVLRDYHVDNLMVIEGRTGVAACGLLDFQDGLLGSAAYDLVSLTQDARRDLSPGLEDRLIERYLGQRPTLERERFLADYWLLAAHRHTKILGNFERLSKRDGKHSYLDHIPRVQRQLTRALEEASLDYIRELMDSRLPSWSTHQPAQPSFFDGQQKAKTA